MTLGGEDQCDQRKILVCGKQTDGTVFHSLLMNIAMLGCPGPQTAASALEIEVAQVDVEDPGDRPQQQESPELKRELRAWPGDGWHFRSV